MDNTKVLIKESSIKGKGVFAVRDFKMGDVLIVWHPKQLVKREQVRFLSKEEQNHTTYAGNGKYYVVGIPERFVNHSCEPNTYVKNRRDIALRNITKGEEITTHYSLNSFDDWKLKCNCGSRKCRRIVYGDFRKLDAKTRNRLEPYLGQWFKEELRNSLKTHHQAQ